jgi:hypothetical protein
VGAIITVCPVTGEDIPTGIETDRKTFAMIGQIVGRVWCPQCNAEHEWSVGNARLRDDRTDGE